VVPFQPGVELSLSVLEDQTVHAATGASTTVSAAPERSRCARWQSVARQGPVSEERLALVRFLGGEGGVDEVAREMGAKASIKADI